MAQLVDPLLGFVPLACTVELVPFLFFPSAWDLPFYEFPPTSCPTRPTCYRSCSEVSTPALGSLASDLDGSATAVPRIPDALGGSTMTATAPVTTTWQAPSGCATDAIYQVWSGAESSYIQGPLYTRGSHCFPSGYEPSPTQYYSPAWCPIGYTAACSSLSPVSLGLETETAVICCPTYVASPNVPLGINDVCTVG